MPIQVPLSYQIVPGGNDPAVAPLGLHTSANVTLTSKVETVYVDTTGGPYTVTMPASPGNYEPKVFKDIGGGLSLEACEIDGNGHDIEQDDGSFAATYDMIEDRQNIAWRYSTTLGKWVRMSAGGSGGGGNLVDTYANRPVSGTSGQRFVPTDGGPEFVWDGTLWRPKFDLSLGYEPPSSGWTVLDAGLGAAGSFANGIYELSATTVGSANAVNLAVQSFSYSSTFDIRVRVRQVLSLRNSGGGTGTFASGLVLRDSATGNFQWMHVVANLAKTKQVNVSTYTNATTFSATQISQDSTQWVDDAHTWLRVAQTVSNRVWYVSNDGLRWWQIYSISVGSAYPATPNQVGLGHQGFIASGTGAWDNGMRLESWRVT